MSFKTLEEKENAIESSWTEYEKHMVDTGQHLTYNQYLNSLYDENDAEYELVDYETASHGC